MLTISRKEVKTMDVLGDGLGPKITIYYLGEFQRVIRNEYGDLLRQEWDSWAQGWKDVRKIAGPTDQAIGQAIVRFESANRKR